MPCSSPGTGVSKFKSAGAEQTFFIERRAHALQRFMRRLVVHPELVDDPLLHQFLETDIKVRCPTRPFLQPRATWLGVLAAWRVAFTAGAGCFGVTSPAFTRHAAAGTVGTCRCQSQRETGQACLRCQLWKSMRCVACPGLTRLVLEPRADDAAACLGSKPASYRILRIFLLTTHCAVSCVNASPVVRVRCAAVV